jgi:hypothetical protein
LKPEYAKAAQRLSKNNVALGKVDASVEEALARRFSVEGFPVLKVFHPSNIIIVLRAFLNYPLQMVCSVDLPQELGR